LAERLQGCPEAPLKKEQIMNRPTSLFINDLAAGTRAMRATLTDLGNFAVIEARNRQEALHLLRYKCPDLVVLDLPGNGGLATCRATREVSDLPIVMLSGCNTESDRVEGLDAGADDYITKPCGVRELLARIRAVLRRAPLAESKLGTFVNGNLEIDFARRRATVAGRCAHLTPKEYGVLRFLVSHADKTVTHRSLLQAVWGPDYGDEREYLRTAVKTLRAKIEPEPSRPRYLLTEQWTGYCFSTR
jgi:two-component system KDP operon response regulator KdpE